MSAATTSVRRKTIRDSPFSALCGRCVIRHQPDGYDERAASAAPGGVPAARGGSKLSDVLNDFTVRPIRDLAAELASLELRVAELERLLVPQSRASRRLRVVPPPSEPVRTREGP